MYNLNILEVGFHHPLSCYLNSLSSFMLSKFIHFKFYLNLKSRVIYATFGTYSYINFCLNYLLSQSIWYEMKVHAPSLLLVRVCQNQN